MPEIVKKMEITLEHELEKVDQYSIYQLTSPDQKKRQFDIFIIVELLEKSIGISDHCV